MRDFNIGETPIHWPKELMNVKGKFVVDFGCGEIGVLHLQSWPSTSEQFVEMGAGKVIGIDINNKDIDCLLKRAVDIPNISFLNLEINSAAQIRNFIEDGAEIMKFDIEGAEKYLLELDDETFSRIQEYYIETHSEDLFQGIHSKLTNCGYQIREIMNYTPSNGEIKVIFAYKE